MIPLAVPNLTGNEAAYLQECVASTFVSSVGPFVDRLEVLAAAATGARYAVATASGTSALHLSLIAVGVRHEDLVITPTYTFVASANAIRHAGAHPWFTDITRESWTLDPQLLETTLHTQCEVTGGTLVHIESGRRVAAVMPVYAVGHPAQMDLINEIARRFGIPVVADAAAAIGATFRGSPLGPLARASALSFNGNKTVTSGSGGAVVTDDHELAERVRHLSTTARRGPGYIHDEVGFNYRMSNVQAAVGVAQLERVTSLVAAKRHIASRYVASLVPAAGSAFPHAEWAEPSDWMSGVVLDTAKSLATVVTSLREAGVDAREFWIPMHLQPPYASCLRTTTEVADSLYPFVLTLPSSTGLTDKDQSIVIEAVIKALAD